MEFYEIRKDVPAPPSGKRKTGMTEILRRMEYMDCIVVPNNKKGSVYACAAQAGIKIRTKSNPDGMGTTVWRMDEPEDPPPGAVFENSVTSTDSPFVNAVWKYILTPEGELPTGAYRQDHPYGPNIFYPDLDEQGRPVNLDKKKAKQLKELFS